MDALDYYILVHFCDEPENNGTVHLACVKSVSAVISSIEQKICGIFFSGVGMSHGIGEFLKQTKHHLILA